MSMSASNFNTYFKHRRVHGCRYTPRAKTPNNLLSLRVLHFAVTHIMHIKMRYRIMPFVDERTFLEERAEPPAHAYLL